MTRLAAAASGVGAVDLGGAIGGGHVDDGLGPWPHDRRGEPAQHAHDSQGRAHGNAPGQHHGGERQAGPDGDQGGRGGVDSEDGARSCYFEGSAAASSAVGPVPGS